MGHTFNCRTKEARLLCLYSVGNTSVANSLLVAVSAAIKILSPAWDQQMYFWYKYALSRRYQSLVTKAGQLALPPICERMAVTALATLAASVGLEAVSGGPKQEGTEDFGEEGLTVGGSGFSPAPAVVGATAVSAGPVVPGVLAVATDPARPSSKGSISATSLLPPGMESLSSS